MPIYAYKCAACGFAKDVLQKMSDPPLAECPSCGQAAFEKQLTAAGFQLKGSGWYVTDYCNRNGGADAAAGGGNGDGKADKPAEAAKSEAPAAAGVEAAPAAPSCAASGCGASCASSTK